MLTLSLRSTLLGVVIVLFFRCMATLLNPADRTRGIKWGFVVHTALMFSIVTVYHADNLGLQSLSYVNNREYPGDNDGFPGPFNYQYIIYNKPIAVTPPIMFILNYWLADGLLVSSAPNIVAEASNVSCSSSSIVAVFFTP